jgi:hypothetical protein
VSSADVCVLVDVLVRVIRAGEYIDDGELAEALQVLLDLENELQTRLRRESEA